MATSNFTFGSGNPLNLAVDPYNNTTSAPSTTPYNPMNSNAFVNAVGSTGSTPVVAATPQEVAASIGKENVVASGLGGGPIGKSGNFTDAFAALDELMKSYGLSDLSATLQQLMTEGRSAAEASTLIRYDPKYNASYKARFQGNFDRIDKGLNALSEATYIANENAYAETLKANGLGNMLSTDRKTNEKMFAGYMANDVSSTEFNDRIKTASDNVINADPNVMKTFQQYYGHALTTSDVVSYFLSPTETLPKLQEKVASAQIGTAASEQGLTAPDQTRATELAKQMGGYGQLGNVAGMYQNVADVLPTGQKLSSIYQQAGINYDQTTAENEYLTQNADAAMKRKRLASMERAQFGGDSGVNPTAGNLASARTVQGKF